MAPVVFSHVRKVFGDGTTSVLDLDLEVGDGESVVLLGPPASGKSTVLRMIAGLEDATSGTISIGGATMHGVPAGARDVAMVFHTYALYPHMTVRENLGLPLEMRKRPAPEIAATVELVAGQLGLGALLAERPGALTGAQRQRVAMGRALVRRPAVLLLDDPFANLDARQRAETRADLRTLLREMGTTVVHATSDPDEAQAVGDRIAVMRRGRLEQLDAPDQLGARPATSFVAVGAARPAINLVPAVIEWDGERLVALVGEHVVELGAVSVDRIGDRGALVGRTVILGVAATDVSFGPIDGGPSSERASSISPVSRTGAFLGGVVEGSEVAGLRGHLRVRLDVPAVVVDGGPIPPADGRARVIVVGDGASRGDGAASLATGDRVAVTIDGRAVHLFDAVTGRSLSATG